MKIKDIPFPQAVFLDLRDTELKLIEESLFERKWRIENLAAKKIATTEQLTELHWVKELLDKLFRLRFSSHYNSMSKYYERKTTNRTTSGIGHPIPNTTGAQRCITELKS